MISLDEIRQKFATDGFTSHYPIVINEVTEEFARLSIDVSDGRIYNSVGCTHGGFISVMCDMAAAVLANRDTELFLTTNIETSFIKPSFGPHIEAHAETIAESNNFRHISVRIIDNSGKVTAFAKATMYKVTK